MPTGGRVRLRRSAWLAAAAVLAAAAPVRAAPAIPSPVRASETGWRLSTGIYRTVAVTSGRQVYLLGGHNASGGSITGVYRLNPATGRTSRAGTLALPTHGAAAAVLDRRILVFGGASSSVHDTVQWFHPASGRTTVLGHMPRQRADVTAAVVGRQVVLVGGFDGYGPQSDVWATRDGRSFRVVAHLPQPVRYPAVAVHGSDVYVFGGLISGGEYDGTFTSDVQRIHLPTGAATVVGHLPAALAHAMGAAVGGQLLVMGGSTSAATSVAVYRFDPAADRTRRVAALPAPITDAAVAVAGRSAYLIGGVDAGRPLRGVVRVRIPPSR